MSGLTQVVDGLIQSLEALESQPLEDILVAYHTTNEQYKRLDAERKRLYHALDRLNKKVIPEKFEERDVDKIQIRSLGRSFYPITKYSAATLNKEGLFEWLREVNAESLVSETVNSSTLASFLKERLENGEADAPEEIARLTVYQLTGSSKYTPK